DIKPSNLMVGHDGLVKIMDFGIARMRSGDVLTQTGVVLGSPRYMSPEQVTGKRADHRSDLFSLGVVLYEMLTGRAPFEGENMTAVMLQTLNANPEPPGSRNPRVPAVLDFIVAKMLAKKLDERYQDGRELAADLRECLKSLRGEDAAQLSSSRSMRSIPEAVARHLADETAAEPPHSRRSDAEEEAEAPLTRGLARQFDNLSATLRLAMVTGMSGEFRELQAGGAQAAAEAQPYRLSDTLPQPAMMAPAARSALSRREKLVFAAVIAGTLALAFLIVYF
ncbi:MAG TPA: serine/threonine-protein kinase, partial [Burkholderiales bacterium]